MGNERFLVQYMEFAVLLVAYVAVLVLLLPLYPKFTNSTFSIAATICLTVLFLTLVYFRPDFFRDTAAYAKVYDASQWSWLVNVDLRAREPNTEMEYGYLLLMLLLKSCGFSFRGFSALVSLFSVVAFLVFAKKAACFIDSSSDGRIAAFCHEHRAAAFTIYLVFIGLFYNFVAIRAGLSLALLMLAATFVIEKKLIRALLFVFLAFCIQRMSILGLVPLIILLLVKIPLRKDVYVSTWLFLCALLAFEFFTHIFFSTVGVFIQTVYNGIMTTPLDTSDMFSGSSDEALTRLLMYTGYALFGLIVVSSYEQNDRYARFANLYLAMMLLAIFVNGYSASYRIVDYLFACVLPIAFYAFCKWSAKPDAKMLILMLNAYIFLIVWGKQFLAWSITG